MAKVVLLLALVASSIHAAVIGIDLGARFLKVRAAATWNHG